MKKWGEIAEFTCITLGDPAELLNGNDWAELLLAGDKKVRQTGVAWNMSQDRVDVTATWNLLLRRS